jgi:hypothetical protein
MHSITESSTLPGKLIRNVGLLRGHIYLFICLFIISYDAVLHVLSQLLAMLFMNDGSKIICTNLR